MKLFSKDAFPNLKSCAQYLIKHHFKEIAHENVQLIKRAEPPIFQKIQPDEGHDFYTFLNTYLKMTFTDISEGKGIKASQESLQQWVIDKPKGEAKFEIELVDIIIWFSIQKQIFQKFLKFYTQGFEEALLIIQELELFYMQLESIVIQKFLNKITEHSTDLFSTHKNGGEFLHVSSSFKAILGYGQDELVGKSIFELLHYNDIDPIKNIFHEIWENQTVREFTHRFRNKNNEYNWFESTGNAVRYPNSNDIIELQISSRDITSKKKAELELAREKQYLQAVLENINDAIVACNEDGILSFFNKAARNIHGLSEKSIHPEEWASYYNLYYADGKTLMRKEDIPLFKAFCGHPVENSEIVVAPKNGKKRTFLATSKQILTAENQFWGAVTAMYDITEKKEWEEQLIKKEALLAESQSMAHLGSWEWDIGTDTLLWSDELKNIFQFDPDNLTGTLVSKPYIDFVHPENKNEVKEKILKVINDKKPFTLEHKFIRKDGSIRWALAKGKCLQDENCTVISGILLDITELKTAELKAKEDRRLIQNIANASPDIIYVHDLPSNKAIYMSRDISSALGFDPQKVKIWDNELMRHLVHPDDHEMRESFNQQVLNLKDQELIETRYRIKDIKNKYKWFLFRCTIFERNKKGDPSQIIGVVQDITDKIKAENAVIFREAQLLEAQRLAQAGSFEYDIKKDSLSWSPEMYRIFGHQPNLVSISMGSFENSLHPDDKETIKKAIKESIENLKNFDLEHRIILPDQSVRYISTRGRVFLNKRGEASKLLGSTMDVTERRQSEEELQRKNQTILQAYQRLETAQKDLHRINSRLEDMVKERTRQLLRTNKELKEKNKELLVINSDLDNFIYTASHDLKSPISNMEGLINLLQSEMEGRLNDNESAIMKMISLSINKFKQTIQDLTEITKVQKEINEKSEVVSFEDILNDVKSDIKSMILESEPKIISDFKIKEVPYAVKNLRSIIYNLLTNAIKYRSSERSLVIEISTEKDGHFIILTVTDNGLGLQPDHKGKMFNMFRRFHTHVEGTGIGLYIVKRIIENNGGKIEVESELGKGSSFKVFFNVKELIIYEKI